MTEQFEAKINPQRWHPEPHQEPPPPPPPEEPKSNGRWIILGAVVIAAIILNQDSLSARHLGLIAVFLAAGFAQFNLVCNKGAASMAIWAAVIAGSLYFYTLLGLASFVVGAIVGAKLGFDHLRSGR